MPDIAEFDALTTEFYEVWLHYHPDLAPQAGLPVTGRLLPTRDDDDLAALRAWLEELLLGLDEVNFLALDADRQLDWELLAGAARVEHRELGDCDWHQLDPQRYLPGAVLERLTWGPTEALDDDTRADTLARLLSEVPQHLRRAQEHLQRAAVRLAAPLLHVAAREAQGVRDALRACGRSPWWHQYAQGRAAVLALPQAADAALAGYQHCLVHDLAPRAQGALGCGGAHLGLRLRELHFIECELSDGDRAPAGYAAILRALARAHLALADPPGAPPPVACQAKQLADVCGGRHHFAVTGPERARRLPRRFANDASLAMGWHLYLSHRLARPSPGGGPRPGLAAQRERLLLARLDLELHTGRIDGAAALERLGQHGLGGPTADAHLVQLARHPGEALAGVLGWQLLEQARNLLAAGQRGAFTERDFHDLVVSQGAIPLPLVLRYGLGPTLWQAAYAGVLGR